MKMIQISLRVAPIVVVSLLVMFLECGENLYNLGNMPPREKFQLGKKYFSKGDYDNARIVFEQIARLNIVADYSDSTQYLLAESHFNMENYILAQSEYERLIKNLPSSSLLPKAKFMIAMSYYKLSPSEQLDQEYTVKAAETFEEFIRGFGSQSNQQLVKEANDKLSELNTKLAEKDLKTGIIYKKMGYYDAAIQYLNDSMNNYNEYGPVTVIPKALFESGECYVEMRKYPEAKEAYEALIDNFPQHYLNNKAREKLASLKTEIAKKDTSSFK